ncbi:CYTH domain-containing protein [Gleimia coleocanis]|uniref:CYTH domain-containing protein n=1 Tax=Gleimia coleocanis TaxID=103618 RepID=UPI0002DD73FF|nr:CYTH domain-containing protein [Gleimia coleocanis]
MAVEVERKFLVAGDGWQQLVRDSQHFGQGYLAASENCLVRVRVGADTAWLTLKGRDMQAGSESGSVSGSISEGGLLKRFEFEYEIPVADGQQLLEQLTYASLEKTRFFLDMPEYDWTVDVFSGRYAGLVLLEIEGSGVESLDAAKLPDWVGAEVSNDPAYANANLAKK